MSEFPSSLRGYESQVGMTTFQGCFATAGIIVNLPVGIVSALRAINGFNSNIKTPKKIISSMLYTVSSIANFYFLYVNAQMFGNWRPFDWRSNLVGFAVGSVLFAVKYFEAGGINEEFWSFFRKDQLPKEYRSALNALSNAFKLEETKDYSGAIKEYEKVASFFDDNKYGPKTIDISKELTETPDFFKFKGETKVSEIADWTSSRVEKCQSEHEKAKERYEVTAKVIKKMTEVGVLSESNEIEKALEKIKETKELVKKLDATPIKGNILKISSSPIAKLMEPSFSGISSSKESMIEEIEMNKLSEFSEKLKKKLEEKAREEKKLKEQLELERIASEKEKAEKEQILKELLEQERVVSEIAGEVFKIANAGVSQELQSKYEAAIASYSFSLQSKDENLDINIPVPKEDSEEKSKLFPFGQKKALSEIKELFASRIEKCRKSIKAKAEAEEKLKERLERERIASEIAGEVFKIASAGVSQELQGKYEAAIASYSFSLQSKDENLEISIPVPKEDNENKSKLFPFGQTKPLSEIKKLFASRIEKCRKLMQVKLEEERKLKEEEKRERVVSELAGEVFKIASAGVSQEIQGQYEVAIASYSFSLKSKDEKLEINIPALGEENENKSKLFPFGQTKSLSEIRKIFDSRIKECSRLMQAKAEKARKLKEQLEHERVVSELAGKVFEIANAGASQELQGECKAAIASYSFSVQSKDEDLEISIPVPEEENERKSKLFPFGQKKVLSEIKKHFQLRKEACRKSIKAKAEKARKLKERLERERVANEIAVKVFEFANAGALLELQGEYKAAIASYSFSLKSEDENLEISIPVPEEENENKSKLFPFGEKKPLSEIKKLFASRIEACSKLIIAQEKLTTEIRKFEDEFIRAEACQRGIDYKSATEIYGNVLLQLDLLKTPTGLILFENSIQILKTKAEEFQEFCRKQIPKEESFKKGFAELCAAVSAESIRDYFSALSKYEEAKKHLEKTDKTWSINIERFRQMLKEGQENIPPTMQISKLVSLIEKRIEVCASMFVNVVRLSVDQKLVDERSRALCHLGMEVQLLEQVSDSRADLEKIVEIHKNIYNRICEVEEKWFGNNVEIFWDEKHQIIFKMTNFFHLKMKKISGLLEQKYLFRDRGKIDLAFKEVSLADNITVCFKEMFQKSKGSAVSVLKEKKALVERCSTYEHYLGKHNAAISQMLEVLVEKEGIIHFIRSLNILEFLRNNLLLAIKKIDEKLAGNRFDDTLKAIKKANYVIEHFKIRVNEISSKYNKPPMEVSEGKTLKMRIAYEVAKCIFNGALSKIYNSHIKWFNEVMSERMEKLEQQQIKAKNKIQAIIGEIVLSIENREKDESTT